MFKKICAVLIPVVLLLSVGCSRSKNTGGSNGGLSESSETPKYILTLPAMRYSIGYDSTTGTVSNPCLSSLQDITKQTHVDAGTDAWSYNAQMIESRTQLYDILNASYETNSGLLGVNNSVAVTMSNAFQNEEDSIYVAVANTWDGPSFYVNRDSLNFPNISDAAGFKKSYPTYSSLIKSCGDKYISGFRLGTHFYALFKFSFSSTSERNSVRVSMGTNAFTVKTKKDLDNKMGIDTSKTNVSVTVSLLGGPPDALVSAASVTTVEGFFNFITDYAASLQEQIKEATDPPDPIKAADYAVHAIAYSYKNLLINDFGFSADNPYFTDEPDNTWNNLTPLSSLYSDQLDAYNKLDYIIKNAHVFYSSTDSGKSLTAAEIYTLTWWRDKFKESASFTVDPSDESIDEKKGLRALMNLCSSGPSDAPQMEPATNIYTDPYTDVVSGGTFTLGEYCWNLYGGPTTTFACDGPNACKYIFDKLKGTDEKARLPFFTLETIRSTTSSTGTWEYIADADGNNVLTLPSMVTEIPTDCASLQNASPSLLSDGTYTVYYMGDVDKPYSVDCVNMESASPLTYLSLISSYVTPTIYNDTDTVTYNYKMNGSSSGSINTYKYRGWTKYRIVTTASGVAIDRSDHAYSWVYDPYNVAYDDNMVFSARTGPLVSLNIDLTGTGLALSEDNVIAVKGYGNYATKPAINPFHYYTDANNNIYIEGVTAGLVGDPAFLYMNNDSPDYIWLDYVPDVATNNSGTGIKSKGVYMPVTPDPNKPAEFWCMAWSGAANECPNTPVMRESILHLFQQSQEP